MGRKIKYNKDFVIQWFLERNSKLVGEYSNSNNPIEYECSSCGVITKASCFKVLYRTDSLCLCKKCINLKKSIDRRHPIEYLRTWFKRRDSELISNNYINNTTKIIFICSKCGCEEISSFAHIREKKLILCKRCSFDQGIDTQKHEEEYVRNLLREKGSDLLSKYINFKSKLIFKCSRCGKSQGYSNLHNLLNQNEDFLCRDCQKKKFNENRRHSDEYINKWFISRGSKLVSKYINNNIYITIKCSKCEKIFNYNSYNNLIRCNSECLCGDCRYRRNFGYDTSKYKNSLSFADRNLYRISLWYKLWRKKVLKNYKNKCCITSNRNIHVHHIYNYKRYFKLASLEYNGVVLSKELHVNFHKKYGKINDYFQFKEFYEEILGKEFYLVNKGEIIADLIKPEDIFSLDRRLLINKKYEFNKKGFKYIPIFEFEFLRKPFVINSILNYNLNKCFKKRYARNLKLIELKNKDSNRFLKYNHRQGEINSLVNIGLTDGSKIYSMMSFGKSRFNKNYEWELLRFCSKINYVLPGAASKMFKYFLKKYNPDSMISYCDLRFSNICLEESIYVKLGFKFSHISEPNYWYFKDGEIYSRIQFQKHKLNKILVNFDSNLSEKENMSLNEYQILYDCGNAIFTL